MKNNKFNSKNILKATKPQSEQSFTPQIQTNI